MIHFQISWSRS